MIEQKKPMTPLGKLIHRSGGRAIQEALTMMARYGYTADHLGPKTRQTVLETMASAQSVGGQAAPVEDKN